MKKLLFALCLFVPLSAFTACSDDDDDKKINYGEVPAVAKDFVKKHFADVNGAFDESQISYVEVDKDGTYEVKFRNGMEIDFYANGDWEKIDMNGQPLPQSIALLIPTNAIDYISGRYPDNRIEEIEKKGTQNIEIEIKPADIDILFDLVGNVVKDPGVNGSHKPETIIPGSAPAAITAFVNQHFQGIAITEVKKDYKEYEVELANGAEIEFDLNENFKSIEMDDKSGIGVPLSIITDPKICAGGQNIVNYLADAHRGAKINEFSLLSAYFVGEYKDGYKVELGGNPEYDVYFKKDGSHIDTVID